MLYSGKEYRFDSISSISLERKKYSLLLASFFLELVFSPICTALYFEYVFKCDSIILWTFEADVLIDAE